MLRLTVAPGEPSLCPPAQDGCPSPSSTVLAFRTAVAHLYRLGQSTSHTIMSNSIHDIINDPREYLPFLVMLGGLLIFWGGLCVSVLISVRTSTRQRRFWFALPPLVFGLICVSAQIPVAIDDKATGSQMSFDLRWLFLVPVVCGIAGLALWWRTRREVVA